MAVSEAGKMFSRKQGDHNPRRFWSWFAAEHQGLANSIEALARGEADAEWALIGLTERIHRYDPALEADIFRNLDGTCQMVVTGPKESVDALLSAAPAARTWVFVSGVMSAQTSRVPYRVAPRPSTDASPISAHHEAYALN
jgi:hypothetical protein